jgi:Na+-translocating ferredoxin:NAD+ oxidoreductase RnfG subunit
VSIQKKGWISKTLHLVMTKAGFLGFIFLLFSFGSAIFPGLDKKSIKEIEKTFGTADFKLEPISIQEEINSILPMKIASENLYKVNTSDALLGYAFWNQAPSKTAMFDYLVIFDDSLKIINVKVLVYREDYGGEIGSNRWLKQFIGKSRADRIKAGENIDVISGATISVNSMAKEMDNLLQSIDILQTKDQI